MYDKELAFIDRMIDVLISEIHRVEEEIRVTGEEVGAEGLTDRLEHKLCVYLTKEASPSTEMLQRLAGRSIDVKKMMGFLKISCAEYLNLKNLLVNKDIRNAYYDSRIAGRVDVSGYRISTCLTLLTYMTRELDITEVVAQLAEEEALAILGTAAESLAALYMLISARVKDGILSNAEISKVLVLLESVCNIPNILICGFELRQIAKRNLSDIIIIADTYCKEEDISEQASFRRGIYLRVRDEAQEILDAIRIAYPNDATLSPLATEKEREPDALSTIGGLPAEESFTIEEKQEGETFMVNRDKEYKQEIDCFLNGIKSQPRAIFMPSYSRCVKELTKRHETFAQQYNAASDNKAMLIQQFIKDALAIIESKMNENRAIIGNSRDALLKLQKDFLETIKTIHQPSASASSSSSNSPPLSLFFRQLSRTDTGDKVAANGGITFRNAGSEE